MISVYPLDVDHYNHSYADTYNIYDYWDNIYQLFMEDMRVVKKAGYSYREL